MTTAAISAGARLRSRVCEAEVIVVRAPNSSVVVCCGGLPMVPVGADAAASEPVEGFDGGVLIGKRYVHELSGLEVLCTRSGGGSLSVDSQLLSPKGAKPLPSSD